MPDWIVPALLALCLLLLLWIALRRSDAAPLERLERELRDEIGRQLTGSLASAASGWMLWKAR
jgi:cytochrome c-type biogenesis protein CcmH/NrfF